MASNTLNRPSCTRDCGEKPKNAYVVPFPWRATMAGRRSEERDDISCLCFFGASRARWPRPVTGHDHFDCASRYLASSLADVNSECLASFVRIRGHMRLREAKPARSVPGDDNVVQVARRLHSGMNCNSSGSAPFVAFLESSSWHPDHST
jgi:hypothetical protein